jgi:alpha-1,2-mannosyltransferase
MTIISPGGQARRPRRGWIGLRRLGRGSTRLAQATAPRDHATVSFELLKADGLWAVSLFVIALAFRVATVSTSAGGFWGNPGYDSAVYYASADALSHGQLPYRDFVLLHPPGVTLFTLPFATIGNMTNDHFGFVLANVAFMVVGAANASLIYAIGRAAGVDKFASGSGALFYALWFSAVHADLSIRLEPLSTVAFLGGFLLLTRFSGKRSAFFAGACFGFAMLVKIWWVVPPLLVILWLAIFAARRSRVKFVSLGIAVAGLVIGGPFFLAAPRQMWRMLVQDQLGRSRGVTLVDRLRSISSSSDAFPNDPTARNVAAAVVLALLTLALLGCLKAHQLRVVAIVVVAQTAVLALAPSFFPQYAGYLSGSTALAVSGGVYALRRSRRPRIGLAFVPVLTSVCVVLTVAAASNTSPGIWVVPLQEARPQARQANCVTADTPYALIALDVLARNYDRDCVTWVDVVGKVYDTDRPSPRNVPRVKNAAWQRDLRKYFLSSQLCIIMRLPTGVSPAVRSAISARPRKSLGHGVYVYVPRVR